MAIDMTFSLRSARARTRIKVKEPLLEEGGYVPQGRAIGDLRVSRQITHKAICEGGGGGGGCGCKS